MQSVPGIASSLTLGLVLVGASLPGLAREETAVFQYEKPVAASAEYSTRVVADAQRRPQPARPITPTPGPMDSAVMAAVASPTHDFGFENYQAPSSLAEVDRDEIAALPDPLVEQTSSKVVAMPTETSRSANMPPRLASPLEQAQQLAQSGDIRGALDSLEPAVEQPGSDEERINVFYMKGMLLLAEGDNVGAKEVFAKLVSEFPNLPEPHNNLAAIYASEGDLEKARTLLEGLLKENPEYVVALENLGDVYTKLAADSYRRAQNLGAAQETVAMKLKLLDKLFEPTI